MKQEILFYKGLPASGKDTDAIKRMEKSNGNLKRVNKDLLREMIDDSKWSKEREKHILNVRDTLIEYYVKNGYSVAVTDTNFAPKHLNRIQKIAIKYEIPIVILDMDTPIYECIERNRKRENPVPERVIWDMYYKYILPKKVEANQYDPNLKDAVIFDIDGTLALHGERRPYDYHECLSDKVNYPVANLLKEYAKKDYKVILVTGRENIPYNEIDGVFTYTRKWLIDNEIPFNKLFIRDYKDHRPDNVVKKEIYETYIKGKYNILFVVDDRRKVIDMWREQGLLCLDCAGHEF